MSRVSSAAASVLTVIVSRHTDSPVPATGAMASTEIPARVDQRVQLPGLRNGVGQVLRLGQVGGNGPQPGNVQPVHIPPDHGEPVACGGQRGGNSLANASGGAGHHDFADALLHAEIVRC